MSEDKVLSKEIKIKLLVIIVMSNIFVFLLSSMLHSSDDSLKSNVLTLPRNYESIKIRADLLTAFEYGREISIFNADNNLLSDGFLLAVENETSNYSLVLVSIAREKIQSFDPKSQYKIYPKITSLKKHSKESYEVSY